jgi:hypothetical protein
MKAELRRLVRLKRIERLRAIAKQAAAMQAAEAESTRRQLEGLAERARLLANDYAARNEANDAASLRQSGQFAEGLQRIARGTAGDADQARRMADAKLSVLAAAERKRAAVDDRIDAKARKLARCNLGTALE